jgi:hypothetical protein
LRVALREHQLPEALVGDDGVLVLAEHVLDSLGKRDEAAGLLPTDASASSPA